MRRHPLRRFGHPVNTRWAVSGGTHVFPSRFDAAAMARAVERHRVTDVVLVPTMLQMLVNSPRPHERTCRACAACCRSRAASPARSSPAGAARCSATGSASPATRFPAAPSSSTPLPPSGPGTPRLLAGAPRPRPLPGRDRLAKLN
ncbi:AMP-binding protein [Pseudonocardia xinjiangensis]|uniref:AMP-binding protein n=1 Tax=Pseudonocardia xinjiangensis TaxID=75289 RepID=UPI003D8ADC31